MATLGLPQLTLRVDELEQLRQTQHDLQTAIAARRRAGEGFADLIERSRAVSAQIKMAEAARPSAASSRSAALRIATADTPAAITALRDEWQALEAVSPGAGLFSTWAWLEPWYHSYHDSGAIRCLLARDERDRLVGVAPLFMPHRGDGRIRPRQLAFASTVGPAWGLYQEFLLQPGREEPVTKAFLSHLLQTPDWDSIKLLRVDPSGSLPGLLARLAPAVDLRMLVGRGLTTAVHDLPDRPEDALASMASKDQRNRCRACERRLREELPDVEMGRVDDPDEQQFVLSELARLHVERFSPRQRSSHFATMRYRACYLRSCGHHAARGRLRVYAMRRPGQVMAVAVWQIFGDCMHLAYASFDPAFTHYSPSQLLVLYAMEDAIKSGLGQIDMLAMYPYKRDVCRGTRQLVDIELIRDTVPALLPVIRDLSGRAFRLTGKWLLRRR